MVDNLQKNNSETFVYLNKLRIIGAIFVISIHVCAAFYYVNVEEFSSIQWTISTYLNCLSRCAVPIFFFISGALYLNENKSYSNRYILVKAVRYVAIFVIWDIVYYIIDSFTNVRGGDITLLIDYKYHLWYIPAYIGMLLLVPVLKLICRKENRSQVKYLLLIFFISFCCFNTVKLFINNLDVENFVFKKIKKIFEFIDIFKINGLADVPILFISGWYFSTFDFEKHINKARLNLIFGLFIPLLIVLFCVLDKSTFAFDIYSNFYAFFTYVLTVSIFLVFRYSKKANKETKLSSFISNRTFGVYLTHAIFVDLILCCIKNYMMTINSPIYFAFLIIYVIFIVFVLSILLSTILYLIPKKIRNWIC